MAQDIHTIINGTYDSDSSLNKLYDTHINVTDKAFIQSHPAPTLTKANKLYWITDRTPHEARATPTGGYRQFFRLVVGRISTWYAKHNTPNPLCDPDAPVSYEDKF